MSSRFLIRRARAVLRLCPLATALGLLAAVASLQGCAQRDAGRRQTAVRVADLLYGAQRMDSGSTATYPHGALGNETRLVLHKAGSAPGETAAKNNDQPSRVTHARFRVEIPANAEMEFGYGLQPAPDKRLETLTFQVLARHAGKTETLLNRTLRPQADVMDGWYDAHVSLAKQRGNTDLEFTTIASGTADARVYFNAPVITAPAKQAGPQNLLLISLDTLRADHLGIYGYQRATSPNIDRIFSREGIVVDRVITQATTTMLSHTAMLTGVLPTTATVRTGEGRVQIGWLVSLADVLRRAGYRTAAYTEDAMVAGSFGFQRGFERYYEDKGIEGEHEAAGHIERTFARGLAWLERHKDEPFFLFLHSYQVHNPYTPPPEYENLFPTPAGASPQRVDMDLYDREIAYTDAEVGRLIARLDEMGLAKSTIIVVTSDHGEEFGEHGGRFHGAHLISEVLHVPLLLRAPGLLPSAVRRPGPMALLDLMPTLLDLLGLPVPLAVQGHSRVEHLRSGAAIASEPIYTEARPEFAFTYDGIDETWQPPSFAVTLWPLRLTRSHSMAALHYEMYNLDADPGERDDLYPRQGARQTKLRTLLDRYEANCHRQQQAMAFHFTGAPPATPPPSPIDAARQDKLRALGYLQ